MHALDYTVIYDVSISQCVGVVTFHNMIHSWAPAGFFPGGQIRGLGTKVLQRGHGMEPKWELP